MRKSKKLNFLTLPENLSTFFPYALELKHITIASRFLRTIALYKNKWFFHFD